MIDDYGLAQSFADRLYDIVNDLRDDSDWILEVIDAAGLEPTSVNIGLVKQYIEDAAESASWNG